jgi:DNA-binding CsgD family transcriptional regulator
MQPTVQLAHPPRAPRLSPREHEILGLLSQGLTGRAIARQLFLSPETVRTHIRNATTKLGAKTRVHAVALMLTRELAGLPIPS